MLRIILDSIAKSYSGTPLFENLNVEIRSGDRLALVGLNGCGKSTLIKIIAGVVSPDHGQVAIPSGARLGYVAQELTPSELDMSLEGFVLGVLPSWSAFWEKWQAAVKAGDESAIQQLGAEQHELEAICGYNPEHKAEAILQGLGFSREQFTHPLKRLSGGWRERAKLARVLLAGADILLLDEPTNHLDLEAVTWLEEYLRGYAGILIFVAHDRFFLDHIANKILFLGGGKPILRPGNLESFLAWHQESVLSARHKAEALESEIAKKEAFIARFRYKATKAVQAQSRLKQVDRLKKELAAIQPEELRQQRLAFSWPTPSRGNRTVLSVSHVDFSYPDHALVLQDITFNLYRGQKIALVGPNGQGKSTLIKIIMGELAPDRGSVTLGGLCKVGYFCQHQADMLCTANNVLAEIRRLSDPSTTDEELKSVLGRFMLGESFWEKSVVDLSGGEKNRLVLASLFLSKANFFVLDEPTNHLDLESREALVQALNDFPGTILLVAHDRYLLENIAQEVWELKDCGLTVYQDGFHAYQEAMRNNVVRNQKKSEATISKANRNESKRLKRLQAERRNRVYALLKPLKKKYARLEKELEKNFEEQERFEVILADPAMYADGKKVREVNMQFAKTRDEGERLMTELAYLEKEMQEIEEQHTVTELQDELA
ncbi:ribosomal protection-like ABC-F family protein [Desulfoplanes formicivorans]|uniref:ABC transporter ATP-binding protein n=1 Tax=Desulfoplanes formicivorans TaxID=1592317 RepID=A0A194ADS0_9BACT|nr:ABC-F family ATP-binding cassette domain-containing protein [Desulfoplanes formicivorans]GAU07350.1 ABC transporter ATP-binding protein [Desulfoplanes formicivorans]